MPITSYFTVNGMLIGEQSDGVNTDYVPDALGSVVAAVDQNLNTTYTAAYKPYGGVLASTGTAPNFGCVGSHGLNSSAGGDYAEFYFNDSFVSPRTASWVEQSSIWPMAPAHAAGPVADVGIVPNGGMDDIHSDPTAPSIIGTPLDKTVKCGKLKSEKLVGICGPPYTASNICTTMVGDRFKRYYQLYSLCLYKQTYHHGVKYYCDQCHLQRAPGPAQLQHRPTASA